MTKRIFQSICVVAVTVLLATLILIMGVLYDYFSRVQNRAYFRTQENGQAITAWFTLFTAGSNGTGSDFNNIAKSGSYGIFGSGTDKHAPYAGAYGTLQVYQSNQYITQTFISVTDAKTSVRAYNGSVWTAWKTL